MKNGLFLLLFLSSSAFAWFFDDDRPPVVYHNDDFEVISATVTEYNRSQRYCSNDKLRHIQSFTISGLSTGFEPILGRGYSPDNIIEKDLSDVSATWDKGTLTDTVRRTYKLLTDGLDIYTYYSIWTADTDEVEEYLIHIGRFVSLDDDDDEEPRTFYFVSDIDFINFNYREKLEFDGTIVLNRYLMTWSGVETKIDRSLIPEDRLIPCL